MRSLGSKCAKTLVVCVALLTLGAIVSSAAFATEYVFKVKGSTLGSGVKKEITSKAAKEFVVNWNYLAVKGKVGCQSETLNAAAKPAIVGGTPGKAEKEIIEIGGSCSAVFGGNLCSTLQLTPKAVNGELVTVVLPATQAGKSAMLFTPESGTVFLGVKMTGCSGIISTVESQLEGTLAALNSPEKLEQATGTQTWSATEPITKVKKSNGTEVTVGLQAGGETATFSGQAEIKLVSAENWGVF